ncbi:MAG: Glu/Leu/Phe/Val dehydrogenase dimerization domain-containing protein [Polyangiales bacterium]
MGQDDSSDVFGELAAIGGGELHIRFDPGTELRAIVAVHDTRLGPALGGCRFIRYASQAAAVTDALRLARAMTSKAALARLRHGGGKAVLIEPAGEYDRKALLTGFARFVGDLGGRYITTEDSGTSPEDMQVVRQHTKHVCGADVRGGGSGDPSPFTALGVRRGIEACVKLALGKDNLTGVRVAVQGVGHVGYHLCKELAASGARLTVADVRDELAARAAADFGAQIVNSAAIHRSECDVYAPCALGGAINDRTLPELRCKIVAGAANNQLASDHNGLMLQERGILYAPDYAINAGGLINVAQEVAGYDEQKARERTLRIYDTILEICERAKSEKTPPHRIADAMVGEILAKA